MNRKRRLKYVAARNGVRYVVAVAQALILLLWTVAPSEAGRKHPKIIDYQKHLNKKFKKVRRKSTQFVIIHTSEAGMKSTLRTMSEGKSVGKYRTVGGHGHYMVARDGKIYRVLHHRYRADHAGLSMWNGVTDLSSHSLGIEVVGYHYGNITPQQYDSLSRLVKSLQKIYRIPDKNVLTHSQVSYGKPNAWFPKNHRGRKRCALNFDRAKIGLKGYWAHDPDVKARRLTRDRHIHLAFYKKRPKKTGSVAKVVPVTDTPPPSTGTPADSTIAKAEVIPAMKNATIGNPTEENIRVQNLSNIIGKDNTAWNIAGEEYDDSTTLYVLPDRRTVRGDQLADAVGWDRIPPGTRVMVNQPLDIEKNEGPLFLVSKEYTAWGYAGPKYARPNTFYFLPTGRIARGDHVADWDSIPDGTRMIIGYVGPLTIQALKGKTPWGLAGKAHNRKETIYFIPGKGAVTGDTIKNFSDLPRGSKLFLKVKG